MIYLDNASTSFPKPTQVYEEIDKFLRNMCSNPGRSGHNMSVSSAKEVQKARETVGKFFNIQNPMQICFMKNATEAINTALWGLLKSDDHVITTSMEHNSVVRPLIAIEKSRAITISFAKCNQFGEVDIDNLIKLINSKTKLIISTLSSNVNGIIMPIREIANIAHQHDIIFMLDASQGAGSIPIDVQNIGIDILALPGHKGLMGPQGIGVLYINPKIKINPLIQGGTGSDSINIYQPELMPDALESGTLNTPGIVGLSTALEYINSVGINTIREHKNNLIKKLTNGINEINEFKIYSKENIDYNSGIVAFNFKDMDSTEFSYILDKKYTIASRSGLHCAPLAHRTLGTVNTGIVRLSVGYFNTEEEIEFTIKALQHIFN